MWSLIDRKGQIAAIVSMGIVVAWAIDAVYALLFGYHAGVLKWISLTITIVSALIFSAASMSWRWLWHKFPILGQSIFPDLNGVWIGHLHSTWRNSETDDLLPPIPATINLRQGLFDTHVSLKTGESTSHSTRSFLEPFRGTKRFRIWYSYNNDPQAQFQHRSSPHEGVAFLEVDLDSDPHLLNGRYYTARKTTGDMVFRREQH